jgi:AcrR family transcriptional regulator
MTTETQDDCRKRYHHGDLRAALIEAALQIVSEKRVEDFSVADAARAVGVSSAAPYRHFEDRDDLLAHVAAAGFEQMRERTQAATAKHPPGSVDGIIAGGCAYVEFGANHPELFHLMWGATRPHGANAIARDTGESCYGTFISSLTLTMEAQGLGHLDPYKLGEPLWAMVHGFANLLIGKTEMLHSDMTAVRQRIDEATRAYFSGMSR